MHNAPNEAWAAAAASAGVDMDADSGSGSGGGAIEARFKALEDENAKLRQEMGGVASTVKDLVTTVKDIGANMNMGFAQVAQLLQTNQQGQVALLSLIQGTTDASVAMIGHAVAGLPGTALCDAGTDSGGSHGIRRQWRSDCEWSWSRRSE